MENHFAGIVPEGKYFECSPEVEHYGDLIGRYFALTDGQLTLNKLQKMQHGRGLKLRLTINQQQMECTIDHFSGYSEEIADLCNEVLAKFKPDERRRFFALSGPDFDCCGLYVEPSLLLELSDRQLIFLSPDDYGEIRYQMKQEQRAGRKAAEKKSFIRKIRDLFKRI
ncbi:hypothetical protein [Flavilitoribacter nigricans]|uniref:Uncharacterized protein n=1 Tax=Flavilitoribacter nigricans (strain ATCC 23147 / DSM 23189 / NBRC 102662 / NCIMB 1420 / SS-2) TaxID=1122177 RepID=A0A2D0N5Q3_FLAN2|nr:hypothetical protein [Flavilitoribacter nigricans]PHN03777.1 hypothetical protein CRP01_24835 [Flavilitoribacter nigricans DSM 23189 = NBRC 102662]